MGGSYTEMIQILTDLWAKIEEGETRSGVWAPISVHILAIPT